MVRELQLAGDHVPRECFHITLHSLGTYERLSPSVLDAACRAVSAIALPAFDIMFDRGMSFRRIGAKPPFVLRTGGDTAALMTLHSVLGDAMCATGLHRLVSRRFTPHMTLLYGTRLVAELAVEPLEWTVRDLVLVHSLFGCGEHVHLARWPLRG